VAGCPGIGDDVAARSARPDGIHAWDCLDQVWLDVVEAEEPVAVVAGRRWGTPPGTCRTDLAGETEHHLGATLVRFDNLTRPGACAAWAAIFFREHAVRFLPLAEPAVVFTQAADEIVTSGPPPDRADVPVDVYYPSSATKAVRLAVHQAMEVFGPSNRSGIRLQVHKKEGVSCPPVSLASSKIEICYLSGGTQEGRLTGRHIDVLGGQTESTVSHFLGQALGLPVLTTTGQAFTANVMQANPNARGQKLTLSQVFQINAALDSKLCGGPPCPVLSQDVSP
jgi:hypothetical protein